jgi:putative FmdB family regulatory protein
MPVFDYRCTACNEEHEALIRHYDDPNPPCPKCGAPTERCELSYRRLKNGWHANHSSLRLHFNYPDR